MSGCTRCRWGTNTNPDRPMNTENAKRLESGLQNLLAERQIMDGIWDPKPLQTSLQVPLIQEVALSKPSAPIPIPKRPVSQHMEIPVEPVFSPSKPPPPPQKKNYAGILYN